MNDFLLRLLKTYSPTGCETSITKVIEEYLSDVDCKITSDVLGNRIVEMGNAQKTLMLAAHSDEIGFIITYIDDDGFLFFEQLGGHDNVMISGRQVAILTKNGIVKGLTGKKAIHLMTQTERKEVPQTHQVWVDIGVSSKEEALEKVSIGDSFVVDTFNVELNSNRVASRAFDDKAGCYSIFEMLKRLAKKSLDCKVVAVATSQEEIGTRGAIPAGYKVNPDVALVVDVEHATDFPSCDKRKYGHIKLGEGPVISRGPNINPNVFDRLVECAKNSDIKYQVNAESRPTGTDARVIQISREGVATGLVGIPLRYMHTPNEVADLSDIENTVKLLEAFALSLKNSDDFTY